MLVLVASLSLASGLRTLPEENTALDLLATALVAVITLYCFNVEILLLNTWPGVSFSDFRVTYCGFTLA